MRKFAKTGDVIEWLDKEGKNQVGSVLHIYSNSVCVDITKSPNYNPMEMFDRTVVAHKRYQVIG